MEEQVQASSPDKGSSGLYFWLLFLLLICGAVYAGWEEIQDANYQLQGKSEKDLFNESVKFERLQDVRTLILDTAGKGVKLSGKKVYWDINTDGFENAVDWIVKENAFVGIDKNKNGYIDDHSEIFGAAGVGAFDELAALDSNRDLMVDAQDERFGEIILWFDVNHNGRASKKEIWPASQAIRRFSLNQNVVYRWQDDLKKYSVLEVIKIRHSRPSMVAVKGYAELIDGRKVALEDWKLKFDLMNTLFRYQVSSPRVRSLPNLRGIGQIPSLAVAMELDSDAGDPNNILEKIERFHQKSLEEIFVNYEQTQNDFVQIFYRWARVDKVDPATRGENIDARQISLLEKVSGEPFRQLGFLQNPRPNAAHLSKQAFIKAADANAAQLIVQGAGRGLFLGQPRLSFASARLTYPARLDMDKVNELAMKARAKYGKREMLLFWVFVIKYLDSLIGIDKVHVQDLKNLDNAISQTVPGARIKSAMTYIEWEEHANRHTQFDFSTYSYH